MSEIVKKLDVLDGGLKICNNKRNLPGCLRFIDNKLEIFSGTIDCEKNEWSNLMPRIASKDNLGLIKIGNNLYINEETGELNSISSSKSQIYQNIIHISPHKFIGNDNSDLSKSDFYNINDAINFILSTFNSKRNLYNQWIIKLCPGLYIEKEIILPPFISLIGYGNDNTYIEVDNIKLGSNTKLQDITIMSKNSLIIDSEFIDKKMIGKKLDLTNLIKIENVNFINDIFDRDKFLELKNGNLEMINCNLHFKCIENNIENRNIIDLGIGSKILIHNSNFNIINSNINTNIINSKYSDIIIRNSNLGIDYDLDYVENIKCSVVCISNLYSNIDIYNSIITNNYENGTIIDNLEDLVFFTELVPKLKYNKNIIKFDLELPVFNNIKGILVNENKFNIVNIKKNGKSIIIKTDSKSNNMKEGDYEDVIIEFLYKINNFNSLLKGDNIINLNTHYLYTDL